MSRDPTRSSAALFWKPLAIPRWIRRSTDLPLVAAYLRLVTPSSLFPYLPLSTFALFRTQQPHAFSIHKAHPLLMERPVDDDGVRKTAVRPARGWEPMASRGRLICAALATYARAPTLIERESCERSAHSPEK
ncbi:hypothetical protein B0H13DRAFT_2363793 [Mycena leptocephala]|nr:hypothetical protein B0H13DRAFT_2363793 [Mycena leptocephala]